MPLKDLQNYVDGTLITADDLNTLGQLVRMVRGMNIPGMFLDTSGVVVRKLGSPPVAAPIVRIAGNLTGQGKYDGYTLKNIAAATAGTNLGTLNNVFLGPAMGMEDDERVIVWNAREQDTNPASPSTGTNTTHLLTSSTNTVILGGRFWISEFVESSTNRRRVVLVDYIPAFACYSL